MVVYLYIIVFLSFTTASALFTYSFQITNSGRIQYSKTIMAKSGYWRDIQDAVNSAVSGDTVVIPTGTYNFVNVGETWGTLTNGYYIGPRVVIPSGISLKGASTTRNPATGQVTSYATILRLPWDVPGTGHYGGKFFFQVNGDNVDDFTQISDIKFVGYRSIDSGSTQMIKGINVLGNCEFRVDHCYFEHITEGDVCVTGEYAHGLIDHCSFVNPVGRVEANWELCTVGYGVAVYRGNGDLWDADITKIFGHYTDYTVFIEDCYFSNWRHCIAANQGAHYVLRHSTIENDWGFGSVDAHGWGVASGSPPVYTDVGTRAVELYENKIINATQSGWATFIRGGSGVAFNNVVGGGMYYAFLYLQNEAAAPATKCWINDWYIWNNIMLTSGPNAYHPNTPCDLIIKYDPTNDINQDINYFLHAPTSWTYTSYVYPHPLTTK